MDPYVIPRTKISPRSINVLKKPKSYKEKDKTHFIIVSETFHVEECTTESNDIW